MQRTFFVPMKFCGVLVALVSLVAVSSLGTTSVAAEDSAEVTSESELHGDAHGDDGHGDAHGAHDAHGDAGSTNPTTLDPDLPIVTGIIFLILLAVLWKFAWGPIVEALDTREKSVAEQLAEAKANQEKSQQLLAEHEAKLASTAAEVKSMLDQARKDADAQKQQIVESAQAAATAEKDRAVREIDAAKNAALQDMAKKSVDTAVNLAGQIVKRQLSHDDHSNLIGDAMRQFSDEN